MKRLLRLPYDHLVLPLLERIPGSSRSFGPVRHLHRSLPEWASTVDPTVCRIEPGPPGESVELAPPARAIARPPGFLERPLTYTCPPRYLAQIAGARVATARLEVVSPDDGLFADLFFSDSPRPPARSAWLPRLPALRRRRGDWASIGTHRAANYYHWLNDCLTRLAALEAAPSDYRLLIPRHGPAFQRASLELLGFSAGDLVEFGEEHWELERLLVPSLTNPPGLSDPRACAWLRERLLAAAGSGRGNGDRLYVSRAEAGKRRLANEEEIVSLLAARGFRSVVAEQLPFAEQVRLFAGAEVVVGVHGAGLANALFQPPGGLLVEILPWHRPKPCFFSLARVVGMRYACLSDRPLDADAAPAWGETDIHLPAERLSRLLDEMEL